MEENTSFIAGLLDISAMGVFSGIIAAAVLYWLMFKDFETFCESLKYWAMSSHRHSNDGMFSEEWWGHTKIIIWLALSGAIAYGVNSMGA